LTGLSDSRNRIFTIIERYDDYLKDNISFDDFYNKVLSPFLIANREYKNDFTDVNTDSLDLCLTNIKNRYDAYRRQLDLGNEQEARKEKKETILVANEIVKILENIREYLSAKKSESVKPVKYDKPIVGGGIFICYSHKDRRWLERLQVHLQPLKRDFGMIVWDDTKIKTGTKWKEEIKDAINNSKVAVLLISADFMASDFIHSNELAPILANAKDKGTTIMPVVLSASWFFDDENLSQYQAANIKPLNQLTKAQQEKTLYRISRNIASISSSGL